MMQDPEIGLCFRLPAQGEERYLIPEALPPGAPDRRRWPEEPLRFRYRYDFLPTGLIPRFIVQSHPPTSNIAASILRSRGLQRCDGRR